MAARPHAPRHEHETSAFVGSYFPRPAAESADTEVARHWLSAALDELDYGMVLLFDGLRILHVNDVAQLELDCAHPLHITGGELRARSSRDAAQLDDAVTAASSRGFRRLLTVGDGAQEATVSVVPLEAADSGKRAVLLVLGKRSVCESLSIQGFARSHGLTSAETRVLLELCNGAPPAKVASKFGVAISTVRSQIGSMRQKTGSSSIRALVRQIAVLPPVKGVLRAAHSAHGAGAEQWLPRVC
jgi:DNA-binding CsgD family transcriptional regulator